MNMGRTKKNVVPSKSKLKKDPGIPRLPSIKVRNAEKQRVKGPPVHTSHDQDSVMASEPTLSSLAQLASSSTDPSSSLQQTEEGGQNKTREQLRKYYVRTLHKVIEQSDVVILVLDARDPEGCRSRLVEEEVRRRESEGKKLVFVLNKIDLIPKANAQAWLKHLRHSTPTLPFKSASSAQRSNISSSTAPALLKLLKAYKPKAGSVTVGVVGFPNTGKSSLINSMKRSKVCAVAAQAGHTKELQSIQLERGLRIVDSPGVVFDEDDDDDFGKGRQKGSVLLRNVVKVEDIEDPIEVVEEIVARTARADLQKIYNLPDFGSTLEFLTMFALSGGRLLKGGTPDLLSAARQVLQDWNHQKIPYFSEPPSIHPSLLPSLVQTTEGTTVAPGAEAVGQAQILTQFSAPFALDGLFNAADAGAFHSGENGKDDSMMEDDEDAEFFDAQETMDNDAFRGSELDAEMPPFNPLKRAHSPTPPPMSPSLASLPSMTAPSSTPALSMHDNEPRQQRQPKRQRRAKDVPSYDAQPDEFVLQTMGKSNPLNRRSLKKESKKARRAAGRAHKALVQAADQGMEVDNEGLGSGLGSTFMG